MRPKCIGCNLYFDTVEEFRVHLKTHWFQKPKKPRGNTSGSLPRRESQKHTRKTSIVVEDVAARLSQNLTPSVKTELTDAPLKERSTEQKMLQFLNKYKAIEPKASPSPDIDISSPVVITHLALESIPKITSSSNSQPQLSNSQHQMPGPENNDPQKSAQPVNNPSTINTYRARRPTMAPSPNSMTQSNVQNERFYGCAYNGCGMKFFTAYDLNKHVIKHRVETPFQCKACNKKFATEEQLSTHSKIVHNYMVKHFRCHLCPKVYTKSANLGHHIRNIHYDGNPLYGS